MKEETTGKERDGGRVGREREADGDDEQACNDCMEEEEENAEALILMILLLPSSCWSSRTILLPMVHQLLGRRVVGGRGAKGESGCEGRGAMCTAIRAR